MVTAPECRSSGGGDIEDEVGGSNPLGALGDSKWWPPGFRFHPTDEELVLYYLKRKVSRRRIRLHMISDLDVYKWEPWELPEKSVLRSRDKQWYFFSPRDRKYPNGSRSNRTTRCGYWKATGKDRTISHGARAVGNKKTLVFYQGRAPKGQRTDWVMHEYTLDDNVVINCDNPQDCYALYKFFRKSGPGPKNGEQYGAPFREEEWDNDNGDLNDGLGRQDCMADPVSDNISRDESVATVLGNNASSLPFDDGLEDLLLQMTNDHVEIPRQVGFEGHVRSHSIEFDTSYFDASHSKQHDGWCEQDIGADFQVLQPASDCPPPIETLEVTSSVNCSELALLGNDEEFLEIEDFIDPVWGMDEKSQADHADGIDEFYIPHDCFDADMFLAEAMGTLNGTVQSPYFDSFNYNDDAQNQASHSHITNELWTHDQSVNGSTGLESKPVVLAPPASGVVCNDNISNLDGNTRGQTEHAESSPQSWFNSVLAAMLENVPSRPAIASENALIYKALERVTSFKGGQIGTRAFNSTTGGAADLVRRQGGRYGGFVFMSFLVGLGAILWLLTIGAAVKVLKVIWGRFVTS